MKRFLAVLALLSAPLAGCDPSPGCWERATRSGAVIVECR
jgi:hypothetical protein